MGPGRERREGGRSGAEEKKTVNGAKKSAERALLPPPPTPPPELAGLARSALAGRAPRSAFMAPRRTTLRTTTAWSGASANLCFLEPLPRPLASQTTPPPRRRARRGAPRTGPELEAQRRDGLRPGSARQRGTEGSPWEPGRGLVTRTKPDREAIFQCPAGQVGGRLQAKESWLYLPFSQAASVCGDVLPGEGWKAIEGSRAACPPARNPAILGA